MNTPRTRDRAPPEHKSAIHATHDDKRGVGGGREGGGGCVVVVGGDGWRRGEVREREAVRGDEGEGGGRGRVEQGGGW